MPSKAVLIAILGDTHIPDRAQKIPSWIIELLEEKEPDRILFTGDACEYSVIFLLENIAPTYAVKGNMDIGLELPKYLSLNFRGYKFFLIHGHQFGRGNYPALIKLASSAGANVLVCGHTHRLETFKEQGILVINPGSATGAWSGSGEVDEPSLVMVEINKGLKVWHYRGGKDGGTLAWSEGEDEKEA